MTGGWSVTANNTDGLADYKASDLQIAKVTIASSAGTALMAHKMGLAEIELKTATYYAISEANSGTSSITRIQDTNENVTASSSFNTASPYHLPTRKGTTALYYAVVPTGSSSSTQFNSTTGTDQWSDAITATNISSGGVGHYDAYSTRVGTSTYAGSFSYCGTYLTFTVPFTGTYTIECWGASGGAGMVDKVKNSTRIGKGGYTYGEISLGAGTDIYIYVGGKGEDMVHNGSRTYKDAQGGWNGGGIGRYDNSDDDGDGGGGGATDIRLVYGNWNDFTSLKSRIMVAGGGGGGAYRYMWAGCGGNTTGGNIWYYNNYPTETGAKTTLNYSIPGSQTSGYKFGQGQDGTRSGGISSAGGGGGYYGATANQAPEWLLGNASTAGAGGSSFISGYDGCNAINENASSDTGGESNHTGSPNHYSGKVFSNGNMINGDNSMPNYSGSGTITGNSGNGYCRITGTSVVP